MAFYRQVLERVRALPGVKDRGAPAPAAPGRADRRLGAGRGRLRGDARPEREGRLAGRLGRGAGGAGRAARARPLLHRRRHRGLRAGGARERDHGAHVLARTGRARGPHPPGLERGAPLGDRGGHRRRRAPQRRDRAHQGEVLPAPRPVPPLHRLRPAHDEPRPAHGRRSRAARGPAQGRRARDRPERPGGGGAADDARSWRARSPRRGWPAPCSPSSPRSPSCSPRSGSSACSPTWSASGASRSACGSPSAPTPGTSSARSSAPACACPLLGAVLGTLGALGARAAAGRPAPRRACPRPRHVRGGARAPPRRGRPRQPGSRLAGHARRSRGYAARRIARRSGGLLCWPPHAAFRARHGRRPRLALWRPEADRAGRTRRARPCSTTRSSMRGARASRASSS